MGHRYYTDFHIRFISADKKVWKEKGYQLKAIKTALDKMATRRRRVSDEMMDEAAAALAWRLRQPGQASFRCRDEGTSSSYHDAEEKME